MYIKAYLINDRNIFDKLFNKKNLLRFRKKRIKKIVFFKLIWNIYIF